MIHLFFTEYARLEHQSVCSLTFRMTPCFSIFFSSHFSFSLRWMEHLRGGSMNGSQSCFRWSLAKDVFSFFFFFFSGGGGGGLYICLYVLRGSVFPAAPVSTLSLILRMPFFLGQITSSVVKTSLAAYTGYAYICGHRARWNLPLKCNWLLAPDHGIFGLSYGCLCQHDPHVVCFSI